jgi:FkbM family methyltransferase
VSYFKDVIGKCVKRGFRCESFVDCGANHGEISLQLHALFPKAKGYMIEPQPELKAKLGQVASSNKLTYLPYAVARQDGEMTFRYSDQDDYRGGSLGVRKDAKGDEFFNKSAQVQVRSLDSLLAAGEITPPQLLKLDVEGMELETLRGATEVLKSVELICMETMLFRNWVEHPPFAEIMYEAAKMGFVLYDLGQSGYRPYDGALAILDVVLCREDSKLRAYHDWA